MSGLVQVNVALRCVALLGKRAVSQSVIQSRAAVPAYCVQYSQCGKLLQAVLITDYTKYGIRSVSTKFGSHVHR